MIIIDGHQSELQLKNFSNLEELLLNLVDADCMKDRIVTDVFVNKEQFTEIYPHQAEDINTDFIESVEVRSVSSDQMTSDIIGEMTKVVQMMASGSKHIAEMFRKADDAEALELFQDLLDVTRDFMGMLGALSSHLSLHDDKAFIESHAKFSALLAEMTDVLESEDWILLSDLLEYEFLPVVEGWEVLISSFQIEAEKIVRQ